MILLLAPLGASLAAAAVAVAAARRLRPRTAAWLLATTIAAAFSSLMITAWTVAGATLAHDPLSAGALSWCREHLGLAHPLPRWLGFTAVVLAVAITARAALAGRRWWRARGRSSDLVVLATDRPVAFAEAGRRGGVVVSQGMLAGLRPAERSALLEHERSHRRHRHDRFLVVAQLARAMGFLGPADRQLRLSLERWADEDAASAVGDRSVLAAAIARAALLAHDTPTPGLPITGSDVTGRVAALAGPGTAGVAEPRAWAIGAALCVATAVAGTAVQVHHVGALFSALCPH